MNLRALCTIDTLLLLRVHALMSFPFMLQLAKEATMKFNYRPSHNPIQQVAQHYCLS